MSAKKQRGDVAEQAVLLEGLRRGWGALRPIGERFPYDLVFDVGGVLVRCQVRAAWQEAGRGWVVDNRCGPASARHHYAPTDFDVAVVYAEPAFYVFPVGDFLSYAGKITLTPTARAGGFLEAWGHVAG